MKKKFTLGIFFIFIAAATSAQYTRYIVEFTDKKGTQFTIANPSAYLSAKSIARRTKQNIAIDSTDLPISKTYLDSIAAIPNVTIWNQSKWLNQILIITSDVTALDKINSFPFVKANTAIAPAPRPTEEIISRKFDETYDLGNEIISQANGAHH